MDRMKALTLSQAFEDANLPHTIVVPRLVTPATATTPAVYGSWRIEMGRTTYSNDEITSLISLLSGQGVGVQMAAGTLVME